MRILAMRVRQLFLAKFISINVNVGLISVKQMALPLRVLSVFLLFSLASLASAASLEQCETNFAYQVKAPFSGRIRAAKPAVSGEKGNRVAASGRGKAAGAGRTNRDEVQIAPGFTKDQMRTVVGGLLELQGGDATEAISVVRSERHSLDQLLAADPKENLLVRAPMNVMNAAQRMLAVIYSQGSEKIRLPVSNEPVELFHFFSSGTPLTDGTMIVGNEPVMAEFVKNIKSQAAGDRAGVSIVLLVGSHGTGKSETLNLLARGTEKLTSQVDSPFSVYTYEFTNLELIPELHQYFSKIPQAGGGFKLPDFESPLGDSPLVLLPPEYQKVALANAKASASKLIRGLEPRPFLKLDPVSDFIRGQIISHYQKGRGQLTQREIFEALLKHTRIKRVVLGAIQNKMPIIDSQGPDLDVQGLFIGPNPAVKLLYGASHPLAWNLNGKILSGHGNAILFDEFFRNPKELKDMLLGAFESRRLQNGGSPIVHFDSLIIAATNTANLNEARADGLGAASADRFERSPMRWLLYPGQMAQFLLNSKAQELYAQKLSEEGSPIEPGKIVELFPRMEGLTKIVTTDGNYRLFFGTGDERVEVAPHTIMLMAEVAAASRYVIDTKKADEALGGGKVTQDAIFRDPVERLLFYEGDKPGTPAETVAEVGRLSKLLNEGESGLSQRDVGRWLQKAVEEARASGRKTLTPGIALKVFKSRMDVGQFDVPSIAERLRLEGLQRTIVHRLLIPRLRRDIHRALANGDQVVRDGYDDMLDEMTELERNPGAIEYKSRRTGEMRPVDQRRNRRVRELFREANGQDLNISQIAIFHVAQASGSDMSKTNPHPGLYTAIAEYYAEIHTQVANISALVEFERSRHGNDEVKALHTSLVGELKKMGYNEAAVHDALMLIQFYESQNRAQR